MADRVKVELGAVQETLFIPLAARALDAGRKRPVLRDPRAAGILEATDFDAEKYGRGWAGSIMVLRTAIFDCFVRGFLAEHPGGTVVEIGAGLNSRSDRADNGQAHWIDLDLPDTIELRRRFFADSPRHQMVAASVLDQDWLPAVRESPAPYFFAAEGVLVYLEQAPEVIARIAGSFPAALIAFDTHSQRMHRLQHQTAARKNIDALWAWPCDDPRTLEPLGLQIIQQASVTRRPPNYAGGCRPGTGTRCRRPGGSPATSPQSRSSGPHPMILRAVDPGLGREGGRHAEKSSYHESTSARSFSRSIIGCRTASSRRRRSRRIVSGDGSPPSSASTA